MLDFLRHIEEWLDAKINQIRDWFSRIVALDFVISEIALACLVILGFNLMSFILIMWIFVYIIVGIGGWWWIVLCGIHGFTWGIAHGYIEDFLNQKGCIK